VPAHANAGGLSLAVQGSKLLLSQLLLLLLVCPARRCCRCRLLDLL
jgi:hypothetical protein